MIIPPVVFQTSWFIERAYWRHRAGVKRIHSVIWRLTHEVKLLLISLNMAVTIYLCKNHEMKNGDECKMKRRKGRHFLHFTVLQCSTDYVESAKGNCHLEIRCEV